MRTTTDPRVAIKRYVLKPDQRGGHLREMAERMAEDDVVQLRVPPDDREVARRGNVDKAAETIAGFIHLAWGGAGLAEYARRTYEMLCALQGRMRGMHPDATWQYAITALNVDMQARLRRAQNIVLDPDSERELVQHFFDKLKEYDYLHDLVENIKRLHWERRHSPDSPTTTGTVKKRVLVGPRGKPALEKHLERAATEALTTYIEQANIVRGIIENPTDTGIVLRDRIDIQRELGGIDEHTWEAAGVKLAGSIESHFGTRAGRREARLARARWKALNR